MATADEYRKLRDIFGLNALDQSDAQQYIKRLDTLSKLITLCGLIDERHDSLSVLEYNGLIRTAQRLRIEMDAYGNAVYSGEETLWLDIIDSILDDAFLKPPVSYVYLQSSPPAQPETDPQEDVCPHP